MRKLPIVIALCLACNLAHAQASGLEQLTTLRLEARASRRCAGFWLLGFGAVSAVGGGVVAIAGRQNQAFVAAGITTASFGLVNAVLSLGLLDLSGAREAAIMKDAERRADYAQMREAEIAVELQSGQFYAVNAGLDVAYIASGVLLFVLGVARTRSDAWEKGVGVAFASQGALLMAFDIVSWMAANRRASELRALTRSL
jgi:hypothetical protein